jgi:hypothetical protein
MKNALTSRRQLSLILVSAVIGVVSVSPLAAQESSRELFLGLSYLNAALASEAKQGGPIFPRPGAGTARASFVGSRGGLTFNVKSTVGIVAEAGAYLGSRSISTPRPCTQPGQFTYCFRTGPEVMLIYEFLAGLRFTKPDDSVEPFFHILFGPRGGGAGGLYDNGLAGAIGAGVNFKRSDGITLRLQIEDAPKHISGRWSNDLQISVGPVFSF